MRNFYFFILLGLIVASGLSGCTIHRLDVQQGNIIKDEMLEQLTVGINKKQVRFAIGTPLIQDPFHPNRWDYVFTQQPGDQRKVTEYRHITVYFENDELVKVVEHDKQAQTIVQ